MTTVSHFFPDVNDEVDKHQAEEDRWTPGQEIPAQFDRLVEGGMDPEDAADVVDLVDRCVEADRVARLGEEGAESMALTMEINYGSRIPA